MKRSTYPPEIPPILDPKQARMDHIYASNISQRKMNSNYEENIRNKNKTINKLRARNFWKEKTNKGLLLELKKLKLLSEENERSMNDNFGHMATELFKNEARSYNKSSGSKYSQEIKEFAISLHFYRPRANNFVRMSLNLPHPATIRSWSVNIECEPGFLKKSCEFVEGQANEGQKDCVLMLDEISIRKQLQWNKKGPNLLEILTMALLKLKPVTQLPLMPFFSWYVGSRNHGMSPLHTF